MLVLQSRTVENEYTNILICRLGSVNRYLYFCILCLQIVSKHLFIFRKLFSHLLQSIDVDCRRLYGLMHILQHFFYASVCVHESIQRKEKINIVYETGFRHAYCIVFRKSTASVVLLDVRRTLRNNRCRSEAIDSMENPKYCKSIKIYVDCYWTLLAIWFSVHLRID